MKEAIITDLNGLYIEPTHVSSDTYGVMYRWVVPEPELNPETESEDSEELPDLVLIGYIVAYTVPSGLYKPKFNIKKYLEDKETYDTELADYYTALGAWSEESEDPEPSKPKEPDWTTYWVEGLTQEEIDELNKPIPIEEDPEIKQLKASQEAQDATILQLMMSLM